MSQKENFTVEYKDPIGGAYYRVAITDGGWTVEKKKKQAGDYTETRTGHSAVHLRHHLNSTFAPMDVYQAVMNAAQSA